MAAPGVGARRVEVAPERELYECVICRRWSANVLFTHFPEDSLIVQAGWIDEHRHPFMRRFCYLLNAVHSGMERMRRNGTDEARLENLLVVVLELLSYRMGEEAF